MTGAELISAVTPIFEFIGTILNGFESQMIFGVSAAHILYGMGFVGLTLRARARLVANKGDDGND